MPTCQACDSFVSMRFAYVFGDNDGEVTACPACAKQVEIETQGLR